MPLHFHLRITRTYDGVYLLTRHRTDKTQAFHSIDTLEEYIKTMNNPEMLKMYPFYQGFSGYRDYENRIENARRERLQSLLMQIQRDA